MDKFGHFRGKCYLALSLVSDDNFMNLLSKISRILTFRRRGPGRTLCSYHHHLLFLPVPGDHPRVSLHVCQGGAGVREGRHLQAGQAESRWSQGAGTLLRHALHWYLQKSCKLLRTRHEGHLMRQIQMHMRPIQLGKVEFFISFTSTNLLNWMAMDMNIYFRTSGLSASMSLHKRLLLFHLIDSQDVR